MAGGPDRLQRRDVRSSLGRDVVCQLQLARARGVEAHPRDALNDWRDGCSHLSLRRRHRQR